MNKCYETTTGAYTRCFINQAHAPALQLRERSANVRDLDRNVMHAGTPFRQKLSHRSVRPKRFQQLYMRITDGEHADLHALFRHFLGRVNFQPERIAPNCQTLFDAFSGDTDVINF